MTWVRDVVPVLALGLAGAAEALAVFGADGARVGLVVALAIPLLLRRTRPTLALIAVTAAFVVQLPWESARLFDATFVSFVCLLWASYSVGRHASGGTAAYLVVAVAALADGLVIGWSDRSASSGVLAVLILAAPAWVGDAVRVRVATRVTLSEQAAEIADSMTAAADARALEARAQVAAEIQTVLVERVGAMLTDTHRARELMATDPRAVAGLIAGIEGGGREALGDLRRTLAVLRESGTVKGSNPRRATLLEPASRWSLGHWLPIGLVVFSAAEAIGLARHSGVATMLVAGLLGVAMAAPTVIRGSRPVVAAILSWGFACALVSQVDVPISVVVIGMLLAGSAGASPHGRHRVAGLAVALVGVVAVTATGGFSGAGDYAFPATLVSLAWLGGAAMRHQSGLLAEVERQAGELRRVREVRATAAATQERLRLARELHDLVAHHVMVMVVQAGAARRTFESGRVGAEDALATIASTGAATLEELSELLALVDPGRTEPGPAYGMAELERLVDGVRTSGLLVDLQVSGDRRSLPGGLDLVAHRIVQESLTNVIRHARASRAWVRVSYQAAELTLEIRDDGRGLQPQLPAGLGVTGMRERAQMYGGVCELSASEEGGVRVRATLPLAPVGEPA